MKGPSKQTKPRFGVGLAVLCVAQWTVALAQSNHWEQMEGPYGGDVLSIAADSNENMFAVLGFGGVARSTDRGRHWMQVNTGLEGCEVWALSPGLESELFAGVWDSRGGLYRSTNLGESWTRIADGSQVPQPMRIFVTTSGAILASTANDGVIRSSDQGLTWHATAGIPVTYTLAFCYDSLGTILAGCYAGVFRSTDNGLNWFRIGPTANFGDVVSLAAGPNGLLFAGGSAGVARSTDDGLTWTIVNNGFEPARYVAGLVMDSAGNIFAGMQYGLFRSTNSGDSWTLCSPDSSRSSCLPRFINQAGELFVSMDWTLYRTSDQGASWTESIQGMNSTFIRAFNVSSNGRLFLGSDRIYASDDDGATWHMADSTSPVAEPECFAFSPNGTGFAGTPNGVFRSSDNGSTWLPVPDSSLHTSVTSLGIDSTGTVFAGTSWNGLFRSTDDGSSWDQLPSWPWRDQIQTIVFDSGGRAFVLSGWHVYRSTDGAKSWIPTFEWATGLFMVLGVSDELFVGTEASDLWRSTDHGDTWTAVSDGPDGYMTSMLVNPYAGLFIATHLTGVYRSTDNGATWAQFNDGLSCWNVNALILNRLGQLLAGTDRGGVFRTKMPVASISEPNQGHPQVVALSQNYPNPFNPATTIRFSLSVSSRVVLRIFDLLGRQLLTTIMPALSPGDHSLSWDGTGFPSGMYIYQLEAGNTLQARKMLLVR